MTELALLLVGAAVGLGIARWLHLPATPLLVLSGVVLSLLGGLPPTEVLEDVLTLGVGMLLFTAGIELNPDRVGEQRGPAIRVGLAQFAVMGLAGLVMAQLLGFDVRTSMYLALALTASSTLVVVRLLRQRRQMFEPFGRLVIGVLLLQDLLVILLIPVLTRLRAGPAAVLAGLLGAMALVALAAAILRWVAPYLIVRMELDDEGRLLVVLSILFLFIGVADVLELPPVAGAFLAGVSLSAFPISGLVRSELSSLADFFLAILFTSLGALLIFPTAGSVLSALAFAALLLGLTPALVALVAERAGLSSRPALEAGLLLAQASEFSLIVGLQGLVLGQIEAEVFTLITLVTVPTMILTPFLATDRVTWWLMRWHPERRRPAAPPEMNGHIVLLGCGDSGFPLLETLIASGHEVMVVDDDAVVVERLREGEVPCVRGDGSDRRVLERAGAANASLIISTLRRAADNAVVLQHARGVPLLARVFEPEDAEAVARSGGTPILYSQAAADDLLDWLDQADQVGIANERRLRPRV